MYTYTRVTIHLGHLNKYCCQQGDFHWTPDLLANSCKISYTEFHENPTDSLGADTRSQNDPSDLRKERLGADKKPCVLQLF